MGNATTTVVKTASRFSGGIFSKVFKYKLFSIFVVYIILSVFYSGYSTGDWGGAVLKIGGELVNPLEDTYNRLVDLNSGVSGFFNALWKCLLVYFAFYKIWIWYKIVLYVVNFFMKDANSPFIRIVMTSLLFFPIFYFTSAFYSAEVLGESLFYPFELTKGIWIELVKLIGDPSFASNFEITKENVCTNLSGCVI
jgi:hypothetical protein